jgi:hypothetical protein
MSHFNKARFSAIGLLVALVVFVASTGCKDGPKAAEGKVIPKGRILKNGLPLKLDESRQANLPPGDPGLQVIFVKLGGADAGTEYDARIISEPPGSFELIGAEGKGIPPGRYRVMIILAVVGGNDELKGKYGRENSKVEIEVKEGEDVVIDLANFP